MRARCESIYHSREFKSFHLFIQKNWFYKGDRCASFAIAVCPVGAGVSGISLCWELQQYLSLLLLLLLLLALPLCLPQTAMLLAV